MRFVFSRSRLRALVPILLLSISGISPASAAGVQSSLAVTIQQVNPSGAPQNVTCAAHQRCTTSVTIQTLQGKQETLDLNISYVPRSLVVEFHSPDGYLYADDKGDTAGSYAALWHKEVPENNTSTNDVTLFLPAVPHAETPILSVTQEAAQHVAHAAVADLEITTQPAP